MGVGQVIKMRSKADWAKVEKSNFSWVVAFYRESCGFCALLRPEWDNAAAELKRYVRIAAVDVEDHKTGGAQLSSYITGRYSFQIEGVPTIKTFVPTTRAGSKGKRPLVDTYQGERKAKAVVDFARGIMPSFVVNAKAFKDESGITPGPLAVFFSSKSETAAMTKALSSKFRDRLSIAQLTTGQGSPGGTRELANKLAARCGASTPGLCVFLLEESGDVKDLAQALHVIATCASCSFLSVVCGSAPGIDKYPPMWLISHALRCRRAQAVHNEPGKFPGRFCPCKATPP